jgi:hypothetical protein
MISCPNCNNNEPFGALFCSECGARLVVIEMPTTNAIDRNQTGLLMFQPHSSFPSPLPSSPSLGAPDVAISLHLIESGLILHLPRRSEMTIGRVVEGQPLLPDVDLSQYEAFSQGVSACMRR